ncbi:hypothetical protein DAPPUDRAFT_255280 [Daphnia pulex]|uniref:Uncharacterized protein n=1 Tax=Daphnia pulex TaxID=6669 RepID=E9H8W8_DAPPU|nr:hypothetical protein DAPPUDRAFT_255280 [Daphnia pulex]|eukprot:EFX71795.1 hypothetical protein DAPPUDRAFT_255280 [Daphnia pulex]
MAKKKTKKDEQVTDAEEDKDEENFKIDVDKNQKGTDAEEDDGNSKKGDDKDAKETGKQGTDTEEEDEARKFEKRGRKSGGEEMKTILFQ